MTINTNAELPNKSITVSTDQNFIALGDVGSVQVLDQGSENFYDLAAGSQVVGGDSGTIIFDEDKMDTLYGGLTSSVVDAKNTDVFSESNLIVANGSGYNISATKDLLFLQGTGVVTASVDGDFVGFGTDGLDLTLLAKGQDAVFNAGAGNETLQAGLSSANISVYANRAVVNTTNFVATTGAGDDLLVAGTGNATLNGGAGDNVFQFDKNLDAGGNTVIGDFAASQGNRVTLFNYGLNNADLSQILSNAHNDANNNAVLNLDNHTITFQGVSVDSLNQSQFVIGNNIPSTGS